MNQDKMKCPICDQYIAKELTKEIQCSTVCMNCFLTVIEYAQRVSETDIY
jgi:hypothetical protein